MEDLMREYLCQTNDGFGVDYSENHTDRYDDNYYSDYTEHGDYSEDIDNYSDNYD